MVVNGSAVCWPMSLETPKKPDLTASPGKERMLFRTLAHCQQRNTVTTRYNLIQFVGEIAKTGSHNGHLIHQIIERKDQNIFLIPVSITSDRTKQQTITSSQISSMLSQLSQRLPHQLDTVAHPEETKPSSAGSSEPLKHPDPAMPNPEATMNLCMYIYIYSNSTENIWKLQ